MLFVKRRWQFGRISASGRWTLAIAEINKKTDLYVEIESVEKLGLWVNALHFSIIAQEIPRPATQSRENRNHPPPRM